MDDNLYYFNHNREEYVFLGGNIRQINPKYVSILAIIWDWRSEFISDNYDNAWNVPNNLNRIYPVFNYTPIELDIYNHTKKINSKFIIDRKIINEKIDGELLVNFLFNKYPKINIPINFIKLIDDGLNYKQIILLNYLINDSNSTDNIQKIIDKIVELKK